MFAPHYFGVRYFAPRYWAPGDTAVIPPTPSGNRGGRAAGGPSTRPHRFGKKRAHKLALEALEKARQEGRLRKLADVFNEGGTEGSITWAEDEIDIAENVIVKAVERKLQDKFGALPSRAFSSKTSKVAQSVTHAAYSETTRAIEHASEEIADLTRLLDEERRAIEEDDEDVLAVILLDGF